MSTANRLEAMSRAEYLEAERAGHERHEYVGGYVHAMVGASKPHNRIALALASTLRAHLRGGPCDVYISDMKVRTHVAGAEVFYYPDVVVDCQPCDQEPYYTQTPLLVAEVLSESTKSIDEREKRLAYQATETLREYLLLDQLRPQVRLYRRDESQAVWSLESLAKGDRLRLESVALTLAVDEIYANVWR